MVLAAVNWTTVLTELVASLPAIIAACYAGAVHRQIKLPSGKPLGEAVEYAHDTAIANNLLLRTMNGGTMAAGRQAIHEAGSLPPSIPDGAPTEPPPEPPPAS